MRVPLPAGSKRPDEELRKIRTVREKMPHIKIRASGIIPINDFRLSTIRLSVPNQTAGHV